jgi:dienelactone hydrolase
MKYARWFIAAVCLTIACSSLRAENAEQTRAVFLKIVDRPRVELAPEVKDLPADDNLVHQHFTYASGADQRVPGILIKPSGDTKRPVVIICHGTGGKKESQISLMKQFCGKGFIAVAIDGRYHGERCKAGTGDVEYCEAIYEAYKSGNGHPLYFDTVWDLMRLIDYLETRPDVDAKRIGVMGFSKGGIETFLLSGLEPRVAVSVPCIGVQSFKWGLENGGWKSRLGTFQKAINPILKDEGVTASPEFAKKFFDKMLPGIYSIFDGPQMLTIIAPRPLLVCNGEIDDKTPLEGLKLAAAAATSAYKAANAEEKFKFIVQENQGHTVTKESIHTIVDWFTKWLAP